LRLLSGKVGFGRLGLRVGFGQTRAGAVKLGLAAGPFGAEFGGERRVVDPVGKGRLLIEVGDKAFELLDFVLHLVAPHDHENDGLARLTERLPYLFERVAHLSFWIVGHGIGFWFLVFGFWFIDTNHLITSNQG
jgi:hypothetical protein